MKNNIYSNVKQSRLFKPLDLFIYIGIAILILVLFFIFIIFPKGDMINGFKVVIDNKTILTYDFSQSNNALSISNSHSSLCEVQEQDDVIFVKIFIDDSKHHYNTINVDCKNKTVKMYDANCSSSHDCTHFAPISENGGSIICVPHKLSVVSLSSKNSNLVIG